MNFLEILVCLVICACLIGLGRFAPDLRAFNELKRSGEQILQLIHYQRALARTKRKNVPLYFDYIAVKSCPDLPKDKKMANEICRQNLLTLPHKVTLTSVKFGQLNAPANILTIYKNESLSAGTIKLHNKLRDFCEITISTGGRTRLDCTSHE